MLYRSTRGETRRAFAEVLVDSLAPDGGLYVPETVPPLPPLPGAFPAAVAAVTRPFVSPDPLAGDLEEIAAGAYATFRHPDIAPLRDMGDGRHLLELFWGPTLSFKDFALQLVGALLGQVLERDGRSAVVLGATSGDTGSAAIAGFRGQPGVNIVVLYPDGLVSDVQRRQMTTVPDGNVHAVAVDGTFDDCQRLVKAAFGELGTRHTLTAFNSINWGRVMAQAAYYAYTAARFPDGVDFVVPTGNFGNVLSAHLARRMGSPIRKLVIANNANHGIADLVAGGAMRLAAVEASYAPAMDVQIPSNLERYLFEAFDEDPARVREAQEELSATGTLTLDDYTVDRLRADFAARWRPDADIVATIRRVHDATGVVIDPHTAVAWSVAEEQSRDHPTVVVATADPAKFPDVVEKATGTRPALPSEVAKAIDGPERITHIPAELAALADILAPI